MSKRLIVVGVKREEKKKKEKESEIRMEDDMIQDL